jgi:hypothetical protein
MYGNELNERSVAYKCIHRGATDEQNGDCSLQLNSYENVLK